MFPRLRAHVPFAPSRPPRFVFVGVTRSFTRGRSETLASVPNRVKDADRGRVGVRLLGFAPVCGLTSPRPLTLNSSTHFGGSILPWALSSLRVVGHVPHVQPRGLDPARFISLRPASRTPHTQGHGGGPTLSARGLRTPPPGSATPAERPPRDFAECATTFRSRALVCPALQRVGGQMPGRPARGLRTRVGRLPV